MTNSNFHDDGHESGQVEKFFCANQQHRLLAALGAQSYTAVRATTAFLIAGALDVSRLSECIDQVLARHEVLSTAIEPMPGTRRFVQWVEEDSDWQVGEFFYDLSDQDNKAQTLACGDFSQHQGASLQARLVKLEAERFVLQLSMPGVLADSGCLRNLFEELTALYLKRPVEPEPLQYIDYSDWADEIASDETQRAQAGSWLEAIAAYPGTVLPFFAPPDDKAPSQSAETVLSGDRLDTLGDAARRLGVTLPVLLQSLWMCQLFKLGQRNWVELAVLADGRKFDDMAAAMGLYQQWVPLGLALEGEQTLQSLVTQVSQGLDTINQWQEFYSPDSGEQPKVRFEFIELPKTVDGGDIAFEATDMSAGWGQCGVQLNAVSAHGALRLNIVCQAHRFDDGTARLMLNQFERLIEQLVDDTASVGARTVDSLSLLDDASRTFILDTLNDTASSECRFDKPVHWLIAEQAMATPDSVAVSGSDGSLSYAELERRANQLAGLLRQNGVQRDTVVAVYMDRCVDTLLSILAILKLGAAYLPLEISYPSERIEHMLKQSAACLLLTRREWQSQVAAMAVKQLALDELTEQWHGQSHEAPQVTIHPQTLAYIIFTSGSTGMPKGVMVNHRGLANYLMWAKGHYKVEQTEGALAHSPLGFDATVTSVFTPLLCGAEVEMVAEAEVISRLGAALAGEQKLLKITPGHLEMLRSRDDVFNPETRSVLVVGGDSLPGELAAWWQQKLPRASIINEYGPTETVVGCCVNTFCADSDLGPTVPIGGAIANTRLYLLDDKLEMVGIGQVGELYIGGEGVARGYLNRPDLTAERFLPDPYGEPGERIYRTGDLARLSVGGVIECLGRNDNQVKIRGYRIELEEIQAVINRRPEVAHSAVLAISDKQGNKHLAAYLVAKDDYREQALRDYLESVLPQYMVPPYLVELDALPLTVNGKLDKAALPTLESLQHSGADYVAPSSELEKQLAGLWQEALDVDTLGIHDNFFQLGGDSIYGLKVVSKAGRMGLNFSLQDFFNHPTVGALARFIEGNGDVQSSAQPEVIEPFALIDSADKAWLAAAFEGEVTDAYPMTELQRVMMVQTDLHQGKGVYHDIFSYHIRSPLNVEMFNRALAIVAERHEILRTVFVSTEQGNWLQVVKPCRHQIPCFDLQDMTEQQQLQSLQQWHEAEKLQGFDWQEGPLFRIVIHRRTVESFQISISFHHAILDGWSSGLLAAEVFGHYQTLLAGNTPQVAELASNYRDYVAAELSAADNESSREYWHKVLEDFEYVELPRWPNRTPQRQEVNTVHLSLTLEQTGQLQDVATAAGVPFKTVALAAHLTVLRLLYGRTDVTTGYASNGRLEVPDGEQVLGLFLNSLPMRAQSAATCWSQMLTSVFELEQQLMAHRRYPLGEITRSMGNGKPFDVLFNFVHFHVYQQVMQSENFALIDADNFERTSFPLVVNFSRDVQDGHLSLYLVANPETFDDVQLARVGDYLLRALKGIAEQPDSAPEQGLLGTQELALLQRFGATPRAVDIEQTIVGRFAEQAEQHGELTAVLCDGHRLSYRSLDRQSNQLAHRLIAEGVTPGDRVGVMVERSLLLPVVVLGVLKAGACYVPVSTEYPEERRRFMIEDSQIALVLCNEQSAELIDSARALAIETIDFEALSSDKVDGRATPASLAYINYTSGSTGLPKATLIPHRAVVRLVFGDFAEFAPGQKYLHASDLSFDATTFELWGALLSGGCSVIYPPQPLSVDGLEQIICQQQVDVAWLTASLFNVIVDEQVSCLKGLRHLLVGGDKVSPVHVQKVQQAVPGLKLTNGYGPTENTTFSCCYPIPAQNSGVVPIGYPIAGTGVHILDPQMARVPVGVVGELYFSGLGLAHGYLGRADLTAEKFVPNPYGSEPGERLYRSGDLARFLADGRIEFVGRVDKQVKIRGYRIEPGEIEVALSSLPEVDSAAVCARGNEGGHHFLVAYLTLNRPVDDAPEMLRSELSRHLPEYMIPSHFVVVDRMPLTLNGKVDLQQLNEIPLFQQVESADEGFEGELEQQLACVWRQLLGCGRFDRNSDFFNLGGDSIIAMQLVARAKRLGLNLVVRDIYENPTVAALAKVTTRAPVVVAEQGLVVGELPLTPVQHWMFEELDCGYHHFNQAVLMRVTPALDVEVMNRVIEGLYRHHDALRLRFEHREGQWHQWMADDNGCPTLERFEYKDMTSIAGRLQSEFSLAQGPLIRFAFFSDGVSEGRLLVIAHHLLVDGMSWRIVLEDLQLGYRQLRDGQSLDLPHKTSSFKQWSQSLNEYAAQLSPELLEYWHKPEQGALLPLDGEGENRVGSAAHVAVQLDRTMTDNLLKNVAKAYNTEITDLLLAALAATLESFSGEPGHWVTVEGHGREALFDSLNITRTVGWFTSLYPVHLQADDRQPLDALIKGVKEQLRAVPDNGFNYGVARYLGSRSLEAVNPQLSFNYLGQFDQVVDGGDFEFCDEDIGSAYHAQQRRAHAIAIVAMINQGCLHIDWEYSEQLHRPETIRRLAEHYLSKLSAIIDHCCSADAGGFTPSDFFALDRDQSELDDLLSSLSDWDEE